MEENTHGRFLRTVLRNDVHDRLTTFAQSYSTGIGKWDYSVAVLILLDFYEQHSTVAQVNAKLDVLLSSVYSEEEKPSEESKGDTGTEMLGGEIIK
jgi:hypothetical protein